MNDKNTDLNKVQIIAGAQLALIITQLFLGIALLVVSSVPEYSDSSVNTYNQIVILLFFVFLIPAIPTLTSAFTLIKPLERTSKESRNVARKSQLFVFIFCVVTLPPAIGLATNGFWVFMADCILGIISWSLVGKDLKASAK